MNITYPKRKDLRLPGYDYFFPGGDFVTIAAHHSSFYDRIIRSQEELNLICNDVIKNINQETPELLDHVQRG